MSQRREAEIVVIGAGIWGLSVAYHLGSLGFGEEVLSSIETQVSATMSRHKRWAPFDRFSTHRP